MKRSKHNLSHYHLTTADMGQLIPIGCVEALPGDSFRHQTSALIRVTPQLKPLMHPIQARIHHFFVPNRLVWSGWEEFITDQSGAAAVPTISGGAHTEGDLSDYLGIYDDASNDFSALPIRAYNKIYNEYYRDQDVIAEVSEDTNVVQKIAWGKDRFTAARSSPQQGTAVSLPLGTSAPVRGIGVLNAGIGTTTTRTVREAGNSATTDIDGWEIISTQETISGSQAKLVMEENGAGTPYPAIHADLSNATAATIAELREAFALQKYAEARANWGENYVDYLKYIGVNPSDSRLQRPEFLGGGRQGLSFSEVLNTTGANDPGSMVGHGIGAMRSNKYQRYFEEHGWVISLLSVRPRSIYVEALPKKFTRFNMEDYYQKELAGIGDEEVLNKEMYAPDSGPDDVFGYSPRYDTYRHENSYVSAEMRNSTNYDWHLGRIFGGDVALNQSFIECSPTKRAFAEQSEDSLWIMVNHNLQARRMVNKNAHYAGLV